MGERVSAEPDHRGRRIFPIDKLSIAPVFDRSQIANSVRAWDKAGTAGGDGALHRRRAHA